ncbi:MAG TPA: class I SAM-dependent methyltransferase [Acidimicrobiales bacterium]|jgi:SAM-dependent methyltransferase|nr:class I SAM-dependent methyltransferase [Acidimicrobiales bacterium]
MDDDIPQRPAVINPRVAEDFVAMYAATPPWDIGRPQPAFLPLAASGQIRGRVLDAGCGTGEHALMAAAAGLEAVGIDPAIPAIEKAKAKAVTRGLQDRVRFLVGDALDRTTMGALGTFDTVIDSGVFHVFDDEARAHYVDSLAAVTGPGGQVFVLVFSDKIPDGWGPRRVTEAELRSSFGADRWRVDSIVESRLILTFMPDGVDAWLASITGL